MQAKTQSQDPAAQADQAMPGDQAPPKTPTAKVAQAAETPAATVPRFYASQLAKTTRYAGKLPILSALDQDKQYTIAEADAAIAALLQMEVK